MEKSTSFSLGEDYIEFIESLIEPMRYKSKTEVIRAGLRLLAEEEARFRHVEYCLHQGMSTLDDNPFDAEAFYEDLRKKMNR